MPLLGMCDGLNPKRRGTQCKAQSWGAVGGKKAPQKAGERAPGARRLPAGREGLW